MNSWFVPCIIILKIGVEIKLYNAYKKLEYFIKFAVDTSLIGQYNRYVTSEIIEPIK